MRKETKVFSKAKSGINYFGKVAREIKVLFVEEIVAVLQFHLLSCGRGGSAEQGQLRFSLGR